MREELLLTYLAIFLQLYKTSHICGVRSALGKISNNLPFNIYCHDMLFCV